MGKSHIAYCIILAKRGNVYSVQSASHEVKNTIGSLGDPRA